MAYRAGRKQYGKQAAGGTCGAVFIKFVCWQILSLQGKELTGKLAMI
jgi:hypothetical protein